MYCNPFALVITVMFTSIAASNDQEYWIKQAEKNAAKNLDQWPTVVESFISGTNSKLIRDEIVLFQTQISDSVDNMNSFVPNLKSVVNYINSTVAASPNFYRRSVLHTILWYIEGKRDNMSYYLFDGAVNWVLKRLAELNSKGGQSGVLATKLTDAANAIANLRDKLDSQAQNYVKIIANIDKLSEHICKNIEDIRVLASGLADAFEKSTLLADADQVNDSVKSITV
ncbi:uncharacterized protein LOC119080518 [Bradysia coprophila]|uniref:uncharacterized protein LOC119080518 n=1 Tax=Bradysia coprophila TaxID=38358 RepID=UPI00187D8263|nr:uncharacterized protein LOC119080518 [Bradysia coprophila]